MTLGLGMMVGPAVQSNAIAQSLSGSFGISPLYIGIAVAVLMGLVLVGGLKSLSNFANAVVPFMAIIYIAVSVVVMIVNASAIPAAFAMIFHDAFTGTAASGGFLGSSVMLGIRLNALGFKGASVKAFYALASIFGIVGAVGALNTVWSTFDFFFGVCVLCNLVVIFVMRDKIVLLVRDYEERLLTQSWDATAADAVERLGLMEKPEDASSLREGVKIS